MGAVPTDDINTENSVDADTTLELDVRQLPQELRVHLPFPARVRGRNSAGERFELPCVLDSLGAADLALHLPLPVVVGGELAIVIRLSTDANVSGPRVAVRGTVQRVEARVDGTYGVLVVFTRHRFFYATETRA